MWGQSSSPRTARYQISTASRGGWRQARTHLRVTSPSRGRAGTAFRRLVEPDEDANRIPRLRCQGRHGTKIVSDGDGTERHPQQHAAPEGQLLRTVPRHLVRKRSSGRALAVPLPARERLIDASETGKESRLRCNRCDARIARVRTRGSSRTWRAVSQLALPQSTHLSL